MARRSNASQLVVLQQICHAFGSADRWSDVRESIDRWVRAAVGLAEGEGCVRLLLPDSTGRLHLAWPTDGRAEGRGKRSAKRRLVFQTKVPMLMASDDLSGTDVLIQPLVCRGGPVGVLEVEGPGAVIAARRRTLDAVAGLVAVVLRDSEGSRESLGLEPAGTRAPTRDLELGLMWTAHELRAPLLGAKAAIDRALMTSVDESDRRALLRESSAELLHLAESMEPLLRLAGGNASIDWRPTDLAAEVLESIEERAQDIDRHRLKIVSNASPTVRVNGDLVRHAVANIIINALKYSPPGTGVRVSVDEHAGVASVRVMNLGRPRIGASQHQTLFEPFVRGRPGAWSTSGLGLGLSIARRIVEVHGGVIWWRSSGDKTTFCIELPAEPTTEQARAREP